jgi:hypothetical protein
MSFGEGMVQLRASTALPSGVTQRVCEYLELLDGTAASVIQGVHLVGSLAPGGDQER